MVKLFFISTVDKTNLLFTVKALPTHVVQYQSLTKTHNQIVCSYENESHNQKYLDGELFKKGLTSLLMQY